MMISPCRIICLVALALLAPNFLMAQTADQASAPAAQKNIATTPEGQRPHIAFNEYVNEVLRSNLDLSVQRASIALSRAGVTSAAATPDWSLDFGFPTVDLSNQGNPTNFSTGLNVPIELGGKRGRRVRAARADLETVNSEYDDAVRQLRAIATDTFVDALSARDILQSKNKSLSQFDRIVSVNQERRRVGEIGEIELVQSRVERDQFKADVITAQADVASADLVLGQQLGKPEKLSTQLPVPDGTLEVPVRTFDVSQLVTNALERRPDVISKQRAVKAADLRIELANVNLIPDVSVSGSYSHTATGTGGFVQPADNTLGASLSVNLPFSRWRNRGELEAAHATRTQTELQLRSVQLQVEREVRGAYSRYQASVQRLEMYRGGMLKDADRVLEARLYAYQRGGATLLEVIDAQRTSAEVYLAYSQALAEHAHALVTLEQTAAIWDIAF
jgi:cobalt-zinc-cadmium efflux system outer membrane protein